MKIILFLFVSALKLAVAFIGFIILYLCLAAFFTWIPSNMFCKQPEEGVVIYLKTNGVHTDLVLPVYNAIHDWRIKLDTAHFQKRQRPFTYVSIGWGDKGFYLNTPTWADLKFSTAFNAMFGLSTTAMHVTYRTEKLEPSATVKRVVITPEQYRELVKYIESAFQTDANGNFLLIDCCHYEGANDNFYEAHGKYHLFKTCNVWTNSALKKIGVKTAMWAPFDKCVLYHF